MKIQANIKKLGNRKPTTRQMHSNGNIYDVYVSGDKIVSYWYWNEKEEKYHQVCLFYDDEFLTENGEIIKTGRLKRA